LVERVTALEKGDAAQLGRHRGVTAAQMVVVSLIPIAIALAALIWSITKP